MSRTFEELFSGIIWGAFIGVLFIATCTAGCAADAGQVPIPELNCAKDPCDTDPLLLCPAVESGDWYIRDYDNCTCKCTKEYTK